MNRWEIVFSGVLVVLTLFSFLVERGASTASNIRQRSDGCGPHPLIALAAASRPFGSNGVGSLNDVLRAVRADPVVWPVMQNLLRRYDDCIRAADGLHYKRSDDSSVVGPRSSSSVGSGGTAGTNGVIDTRPSRSVMLRGVGASGNGASIISKSSTGSIPPSAIVAVDPEDITSGTDVIFPLLQYPI